MSTFEDLIFSLMPDEFMEKMGVFRKEEKFVSAIDFNACLLKSKILDFRAEMYDLDREYPDLSFSWSSKLKLDRLKKLPYVHECIANATLMGYKSFSISRSSFIVTLISSLFLEEIFDKDEDDLLYYCLCSINLLAYIFYFQIKIPPTPYTKEGFNWYFQFFFNFFEKVLRKILSSFSQERFDMLKTQFLDQYELFQFLFVYYYRIAFMFAGYSDILDNHENGDRLIYYFGSLPKNFQIFTQDQRKKDSISPIFFDYEEDLLGKIGPCDLLLKGMFSNVKSKLFVKTCIKTLYDKKEITEIMRKFVKKGNESVMNELLDLTPFKKFFLTGVREYFSCMFRSDMTREEEKIFDEFQEQLEEFDGDLEKLKKMKIKIPKRIKEESQLFDQFLDFYLSFMSENGCASTDSGELRFFSPRFIHTISSRVANDQKYLHDSNFLQVLCNEFYFSRSFFDRMEGSIKGKKMEENVVYRLSLFLVCQLVIKYLTCIFQDLSSGKKINSDPRLWKWLKKTYGDEMSTILRESDSSFFSLYCSSVLTEPLAREFPIHQEDYMNYLIPQQLINLKNNFYSLEYWVYHKALNLFSKIFLFQQESLLEQLKNIADFRKTLFGSLLFSYYLRENIKREDLFDTVLDFILWSGGDTGNSKIRKNKTLKAVIELLEKFEEPFSYLMEQKENISYCKFLTEMLESSSPILNGDPVYFRFRTALAKMSYFNGSLLIPF